MNKTNPTLFRTKAYDNEQRTINNERYSKRTQFKPKQTQFLLPQTSPLAHSPKRQPKAAAAFFPLAHNPRLFF